MNKTFFFYDLETSGLNAREDRLMQFAGQRTDAELRPIGEPVNILIKMSEDALPSPEAIMVTKITPQMTLADGVSEAEFCRYAVEEIFTPETVAVGYNTVRFDDEFMRALFWRNFYDPYEWQWKDGRSRWDMLDVVRMVRALRPEGINWPFTEDGKATNRLELLTKLNSLEHAHAHDALSDVYATIAVAKMIREKQPKMFEYLFKMRGKNEVKKLVNLEDKKPFVYVSGRYSSEFNKTTVAFPLTTSRNGNILVYDLRHNLERVTDVSIFPVVKELCYNKCPAVAPMVVLDNNDGWDKIGLSRETVQKNLEILLKHPEFAEQMRSEYENRPEFPPAIEPEAALYDGFLDNTDRIKVAAVRNADGNKLADFHPDFHDPRLPDLLLHYKGRNFPESLSEIESKKWEEYRRARLERMAPKFLESLKKIYTQDEFVAEELKLYFENVFALDY
ncbi:exodeoxyribonuclease I [Candidatus Saccharibacteria bacterium]|nr:exodeoxyribonuclease I [Candidatus Saccharibacteria bacterium]